MAHRRARRRVALAALAIAAVLPACGDSDGGARPGRADAYVAVLDWMLEQPEAAFGEHCGDQVVFVESIGADGIPLDVQVALIEHYADDFEMKFIDTREEAVDETESEAPVRDGCLLIGLGPVPEGMVIEVRGELYEERDRATGYRFDLLTTGRTWSLVDEPERVDAEGLVDEL